MPKPQQKWMDLAIQTALQGIQNGQTPFGAVIVRENRLLAAAHNHVFAQTDVTAHAEIEAIRLACRLLATIDLAGCEIYSTCEPCPMCFAACHWANLARIIFGASIADAAGAGFRELSLSNLEMKRQGGSSIQIIEGFMAEPCQNLFKTWAAGGQSRRY
jgi:guanine deaminase